MRHTHTQLQKPHRAVADGPACTPLSTLSLSQIFLVCRVKCHHDFSNSHLKLLGSLLQAAAVVMWDGSLVVLGGAYVLCDSRVLIAAVVVAARLLGVVQELPREQRLHLQHNTAEEVSEKHSE